MLNFPEVCDKLFPPLSLSVCSDSPDHRSDHLPCQIQRADLRGPLLLHLGLRLRLGRHHPLHRLCHPLLLPATLWGWADRPGQDQIHLFLCLKTKPAHMPNYSHFHFSLWARSVLANEHFYTVPFHQRSTVAQFSKIWLGSGKPLLHHPGVKLEAGDDSYWKWTVIGCCVCFNIQTSILD